MLITRSALPNCLRSLPVLAPGIRHNGVLRAAKTRRVNRFSRHYDRIGERSIGIAQLGIAAFILSLHLASAVRHDFSTFSGLVTALLVTLIFSSVTRFYLAGRGALHEPTFVSLTILDASLLVATIWAYCVAYDLPLEASLKSPTMAFFFVFVGLRALRFNPLVPLCAGISITSAWVLSISVVWYFSPEFNVTTKYEHFLVQHTFLLGAELEKAAALLILTGVVALGAQRARDIAVRVSRTSARLHYLAHHDRLTGLPNREQFRQQLDNALKRVNRGEQLAILRLNIDRFKITNESFGNEMGDKLLISVAERLQQSVRNIDAVARLGGDEFAIIQTRCESSHDAAALASRIIDMLAEPFELNGTPVLTGASIGIALAPDNGVTALDLAKNADLALSRAKACGRGMFRFFERAMDDRMQDRRLLELDLREAIESNALTLHYQPFFDLQKGKVCGFEALLRWPHADRGMIPPDHFIPLAEDTGLIEPIGTWVLREACARAAQWPQDISVAVNVSAVQFKKGDLLTEVVQALSDAELPAHRLEIEITESILLDESGTVLEHLQSLRELGVKLSMDDFGTGYSSLSYLQRFPFDKIKIDRSFVRHLHERENDLSIVRAIAGLGCSLGMTTIAEGVETAEQLRLIQREGCTEAQGYLFSPAVPVEEIPDLVASLDLNNITAAEVA